MKQGARGFFVTGTDTGVGKTLIATNIAHQALLAGHSVLAATASELLNRLAACESAQALERRLRALARPDLLLVDELGYLSYDNRYADLLFRMFPAAWGCPTRAPRCFGHTGTRAHGRHRD